MPCGRQNPASQNGSDAHMTGRLASAASMPSRSWHAAAAATDVASPPATHSSVRRLSLPTTFSWYSPMS